MYTTELYETTKSKHMVQVCRRAPEPSNNTSTIFRIYPNYTHSTDKSKAYLHDPPCSVQQLPATSVYNTITPPHAIDFLKGKDRDKGNDETDETQNGTHRQRDGGATTGGTGLHVASR